MLSSLLGGKFSNKCKPSVKCIKLRIVHIRKKKQAILRFLKKDVADLIAGGHEANAFKRIDALILEINCTSCYDMIEQSCECILSQLPSLQKQRECPQEAMEAVSTLIFAAARFSDLPELCDLRHLFVERYGSYMESSVNAEFSEKAQKKSFPNEKKLQLMQNIAEEFSVRWDAMAFDHKLCNGVVPKSDQSKETAPSHPGNNEDSPVETQLKDIHVVSASDNGQFPDPENMESDQTDNAVPPYVKPRKRYDGISKGDERKHGLPQSRREEEQHELDPRVEKKEVASVKPWNAKPVNVAPPFTKLHGRRYHVEETKGKMENDRLLWHEEGLDHTELEKQSVKPAYNSGRAAYLNPPYVKPEITDVPTKGDQTIQNIHDKSDDDRVVRDGKPKPVSVRRKFQKPPATETNDSAINDKPSSHAPSGRDDSYVEEKTSTVRDSRREDDDTHNAVDYGKLSHQTSGGLRRQGSGHSAGMNDEEEVAMDKLLLHYSKKGTAKEASKERTREARAPATGQDDRDRVEYHGNGKIHPIPSETVIPPDRAVSVPSKTVSPVEGKLPARAALAQPDALNPNRGGRVHPKLPDYNQLPARIAALKQT